MADVHDIATRNYNMSRIIGRVTNPEMLIGKYRHAHGIRYRLHIKNLPGESYLTLKKYHVVILVNGRFWNGHKDCKYYVFPKTRSEWRMDKIKETHKRVVKAMEDFNELQYNSVVIWECE